jgi:hypothetical protein
LVAGETVMGDRVDDIVGLQTESHEGLASSVDGLAEHRWPSSDGEQLAGDRFGGGAVVDADQRRPVACRPAVDDDRASGGAGGVEDRVVIGSGPDDVGVHGRLQDPVGVLVADAGWHDQHSVATLGADLRDPGEEHDGLRVVEGVGEVLAEDHTDGVGGPVAQRSCVGVGAAIAEPRRGSQHLGASFVGDPLGPVVGVRHRHRRHAGGMRDICHGHPAGRLWHRPAA